MFQDHIDGGQLISALEAEREFVMTPKMFMHTINRICLRQVCHAAQEETLLRAWIDESLCNMHGCAALQIRDVLSVQVSI